MSTLMKQSRFLFQLNHPAHFHLFKHTINALEARGHEILISIKDKDILKELVADRSYILVSKSYRKNNPLSIIQSLLYRTNRLYNVVRKFRPELMIGTSPEIGYISSITKRYSLFFGEDDVNLSPIMYLGALTCYPHFSSILSPVGVNNGIWNKKTLFYNGFQKLAYLHPNYFIPDRSKVHIQAEHKFFMLRFASLNAYHDKNAKGISNSLAHKIIKNLESKGDVFISSERELPKELRKYEYEGNKNDIHHYLAFADLFICDSQSMAVEAAMLGTPNIRFNNFAGKISVLEELEHKFNLTTGVKSTEPDLLLKKIDTHLLKTNLREEWQKRRQKMLSEKIDVTAFIVWFIENYPESAKILKDNPSFQNSFKIY